MYNNTSRVLPSVSSETPGVFLPYSDKFLTAKDIDKKIDETNSRIVHLKSLLPFRNTHGGKTFRARKVSLQSQIFSALERLTLLQMAKEAIQSTQSSMLETTKSAISGFGKTVPHESQSSTVDFEGYTFTLIDKDG